jgi:spore maturation protein A
LRGNSPARSKPVINYVWICLIILAIGYGAWQDVAGTPPVNQPSPVTVALPTDQGLTLFRAEVAGSTPLATRLDYTFDQSRRAFARTPAMVLKSEPAAPNRFDLPVRGDGGHRVHAEFRNSAGDLFYAASSAKLQGSDDWSVAEFNLTALAPSAENPNARPGWPLTLTAIVVVRPEAGEAAEGTLEIAEGTLLFPKTSTVRDAVSADSWMGVLTKSLTVWTEEAIKLAIGLIGIIMFWLGLMKIAEQAGLVQLIAKALKPIMKLLFPDIPPDGEAMGAIVMNVAANMLGLGNAATPLGLKAMEELQKINQHKEYASNAQCMLLAINTSSVTIIAPTIIGYRAATGSTDLMKFWPVMIAATLISTFFAVLACKVLEKMPIFRIPLPPQLRDQKEGVQA